MAKKVMLRIAPAIGDPGKETPGEGNVIITHRSPAARRLDVRDHLAELIGKGNTMNSQDRATIYGSLSNAIGQDRALKVMNHAYIFNQRPDILKLPIEDKLRSFYDIGSNDPDVNAIINDSKSIGYGVLPGFRESASGINQALSGKIPANALVAGNPNRVMLRVNK